jgi:formate-dependent nitrite reductase cytochrome c552 subunit
MQALDGHAVCENCHGEDADTYHQGTHNMEGLDCIDCHMRPGPGEVGHGGKPHIAHSFTANPESCIECHGETIHIANKIIDTEEQVVALQETGVGELQQEIVTLESEKNDLQANVASRFYAGLVAGAIVALVVGFAAGQFWKRWQHGKPI